MATQKTFRRVLDLLLITSSELSELSPDERQAMADYDKRTMLMIARLVITSARYTMIASLVPLILLPPPEQRIILLGTHLLLLLQMFGYQSVLRVIKIDPRYVFLFMEMTVAVGYGESVHQAFLQGPDLISVTFGSILYIVMTICTILLCPFLNGAVLLVAAFLSANGALAWRSEPYGKLPDWTVLLLLTVAFGLGMFYANTYRRRRELLNDLATREILLQKERSRLASVELDLEAAGQMQETFTPQSSLTASNGFNVQCYQAKYGLLGGDWKAVRTLSNGSSVVIVADATGKGIQAALVIQAVQTLWAEGERDPDFVPLQWLEAVNRTLLSLGGRRHHTMSLGMILLSQEEISYYSAGHLPLFLLCRRPGQAPDVIPMLARGNLLGLSEDLQLVPVTINQNQASVESMLLGTDGVFDRGLRTRKQAVLTLLESVEKNGVKALDDCPAADDKLLVWVKRSA